jgi:hypothetical protein
MATDSPKPMSPTTAVARHVEWLEFALAAARDEEVRRRGRLDNATTKNRDKRTVRLAEVSAEVVELAALVTGLKVLQARGAGPARKPRTTTRSSAGSGRRAQGKAAGAGSSAVSASTATRSAAPKATPAPKAAASKPRATTATTSRKAPTARKRSASGVKPASARTRQPQQTTSTPSASAPTTASPGPTV